MFFNKYIYFLLVSWVLYISGYAYVIGVWNCEHSSVDPHLCRRNYLVTWLLNEAPCFRDIGPHTSKVDNT